MKNRKIKIGLLDYSGLILDYRRSLTSNSDILAQKIADLGYDVFNYRVEDLQVFMENGKSKIYQDGQEIQYPDVLIPRFDLAAVMDQELFYLKEFENRGIKTVTSSEAISLCKNKFKIAVICAKNKIPTPKTTVVKQFDLLQDAVDEVGGYPVIIKAPFGSFGRGVMLAESRRSLFSMIPTLKDAYPHGMFLFQEFIKESAGEDIRVFIVGGKILTAMRRKSKKDDFRSNINAGGQGENVVLSSAEKKLALRAAKVFNLKVAGIDLLRSKRGPLLMEINSNPGFTGITGVTGIDVAAEFIHYAAKIAA